MLSGQQDFFHGSLPGEALAGSMGHMRRPFDGNRAPDAKAARLLHPLA